MKPSDTLKDHFRIDAAHEKALKRLGISTALDLLYHLPSRYEDISEITSVSGLKKGQDAVIFGRIGGLKSRRAWKSKRPIAEGWIEDDSGRIKLMWFNQPYMAKMLQNDMHVKLSGTVTGSEGKLYIANPETEQVDSLPIDTHDSMFKNAGEETIYPVYRESKGVTSKWFFHTVQKCFANGVLGSLDDPIPKTLRKRYNLPELKTAFQWAHVPKKKHHTESARKRFAFEEVFYIQVGKALERREVNAASCYQFKTTEAHVKAFVDRFSFDLTAAQKKAIDAILKDFNGNHAMSRLLEGDVGSGKTAVAATTAYAVATSMAHASNSKTVSEFGNLQVAYMAPTEILARQHFENFIEFFHHLPIQIGLVTGSGCMKFPSKVDPTRPTKISKVQLLKWVKNGEIPILIGTHSLIYKSVKFKRLAHVIIDEQHRFGTSQRKALAKKNHPPTSSSDDIGSSPAKQATGRIGKQVPILPHLLSMTATPIPRTLALTVYGDLDITLLDEMPKGRKPVITELVTTKNGAKEMYAHIQKELDAGRQVYVICPRIQEPDESKANALRLKSVKEEAKRLKEKIFKDATIDILHSKLKPAEKEAVMKKFAQGETDIIVATSVVEVGVSVENATNIIIEGAERFGLAQLHQLRGRVQRSTHQSYCFAVTDSSSQKTKDRLKALKTAKNGFELAEYDLMFRGSGELYGQKQSGLTDLGMEAIKNIKLVEAAREEARTLVERDPKLKQHPQIKEKVASLGESLHME